MQNHLENRVTNTDLKSVFFPLLVEGDKILDEMKHSSFSGDNHTTNLLSIKVGSVMAKIQGELHERHNIDKPD